MKNLPKRTLRCVVVVCALSLLAGCATQPKLSGRPGKIEGADALAAARSRSKPIEERAALYLRAAATTVTMLGSGTERTLAQETYNNATAELTVLLRNNENGKWWNRPLTLSDGGSTWHLRFQPASGGVWSPSYFGSFELASAVKEKRIRKPNVVAGVGGELVGVRNPVPQDDFSPRVGISAPVTAILDFRGKEATLVLRRPAVEEEVEVQGKVRSLAANYSAPLLYYPHVNETVAGLMGALFVNKYMYETGLYFLQPYDPNKIPLVFVHGLISTPQMWLNVINELQEDPVIRQRYQFWVFAYPTGNPVLYSALRLREELAKVDRLYPNHKSYLIVSHSMGGLLARLQVSDFTKSEWEQEMGDEARRAFAELKPDDLISRALLFRANPRVKRIVFICTPHRGSKMALSTIGGIGIRLISLPARMVNVIKSEVDPVTLKQINGGRIPNSVTNLEPNAPYLRVMNQKPIKAPCHTVLGDRGRGDCPNCSDGVVAYWSSHIDQARSELIVPGPHGSCGLPQTIAELDRILRLHLRNE